MVTFCFLQQLYKSYKSNVCILPVYIREIYLPIEMNCNLQVYFLENLHLGNLAELVLDGALVQ